MCGIYFSFSNVRCLATCTHLWKGWPLFVTVLLSFDRGRCRLTSLFPVSGTVGQVRVVFSADQWKVLKVKASASCARSQTTGFGFHC